MPQSPKPFSSEWINAPDPGSELPDRLRRGVNGTVVRLFSGFPGERALTLLVLVLLVLGSFWVGRPGGGEVASTGADLVAEAPDPPQIQFTQPKPTAKADISTDSLQVTEDEEGTGESEPVLPALQLDEPVEEEIPTTPNGLLPNNRILSFYGFPGNPDMGILGEYEMDLLLEHLQEQAMAYEAADPDHPVILAFEVIASVAQQYPQADGSYLLDTPSAVLDQYAEFTRENGLLLILDAQIGHRSVVDDVKGLRPWLEQDNVHLAIDPEFSMPDGVVPGGDIGGVLAEDVIWTQKWLVELAEQQGITPKLLIVHQFLERMIENKADIVPIPGVQVVIDIDGWGPPPQKKSTYDLMNHQAIVEYVGIKLFYQQDEPLMTPEEVVSLDPAPLFVMYQ